MKPIAKIEFERFPSPVLLVFILLHVIGCQRNPKTYVKNPVMTLGLGLSNEIQVGMTLKQIAKSRTDLVITTHRSKTSSFPSLFGELEGYSGSILSLGLEIKASSMDDPISRIVLYVDPMTLTNRFNGSLSCGLRFEGGTRVRRDEIVQIFGSPPDLAGADLLSFLRQVEVFRGNQMRQPRFCIIR
jgi:hypothetical protein